MAVGFKVVSPTTGPRVQPTAERTLRSSGRRMCFGGSEPGCVYCTCVGVVQPDANDEGETNGLIADLVDRLKTTMELVGLNPKPSPWGQPLTQD